MQMAYFGEKEALEECTQEHLKLLKEKENLIKHLESMLDGTVNDLFVVTSVKDLLERIKNNNYE